MTGARASASVSVSAVLAGPSWDDELAEAVARRAKTPSRNPAF